MESIQTRGFTDPAKRAAEAAAIDLAERHTEQLLREYAARVDTHGGRYVCADTFKELLPGYGASRESRNVLNGAVHNAAAVLSSEQFRRLVEQGPAIGRDKVVFVTGIPGAGKSSSVTRAVQKGAAVVFEGQLSRPEPGMQKMQQTLDKGFKVAIVAVHVAPEVALERTHYRFLDPNNGRGASLSVMAEIQGNLPAGLRQIQERYGDQIEFMVLDNNPDKQTLHNGWHAIPTLEKEGNHARIRQRLEAALEAGYEAGRFSAGFYRQAAGKDPVSSLAERTRPGDGGELQANAARPGVPGEDPKHDALIAQDGEQSARQLLANPRATVHVACATGVYVGTIVGETATHWIQRISPNMAVLHEKTRTPALGIGQVGALRYIAGRAEVMPERRPSQDRSLGR
jgi:hypothetical protein